jgi:uncharacterized protein YggE
MNKDNFIYTAGVCVIILAFLWLVNVLDISYPLTIVTTTRSSELSVVGEGKIEAIPDTAYVEVGISIVGATTTQEAQNKIDKINNAIIENVKKLGIQKEDIKTSNYSIYPDYSYEANVNKIKGYNGSVSLSIKVKDKKITSQVIEEATKAGANQVNGLRYAIENPNSLREKARQKAIDNAKLEAEKLAKTLGIKLGKIINIVESGSSNDVIQPMYATKSLGMGGGAESAPVLEEGSQTIYSTVTLYFERK